jgi:D-alanyl-D-alanine carboxypeptidase
MSRWPHDDPASLAAFYGDPGKDEPGKQLVRVVPPFKMTYRDEYTDDDGKRRVRIVPVPYIRFHRKAAPALQAALNEIWEQYGRDQSAIDAAGVSDFGGTYNHRKVRGSDTKWSNHAYGAAIDLNADSNGLGAGHGTMPRIVIDAFKRQGALWGGDYKGRTDPMHFEFCSREGTPPPPAPLPKPVPKPEPEPAPPPVAHEEVPYEPEPVPAPAPDPVPVPAPAPQEEKKPGFFGRLRNWVTGLFTSGGFLGLGALTEWKIAAILFGFLLLLILLGFGTALWLYGKTKVADWIARNLA